MTDLLFAGGNNHAGLFLVRYAPVVGILSLPLPAPSGPLLVNSPPTFADGVGWHTIYGSEGTKFYDEQQDDTPNGPTWTMKIGLFLPGDSAELRGQLAELVRHRFVVECQDNLGVFRRVGTKEQNLELTYKFGINPAMGGRRGAVLTFSGQLTSPPPFLV